MKHNSFSSPKRRSVECQVGDEVLLRVSPTKGVMGFNNKGKLSPHYLGPFKILARVRKLAYHLELSESMKGVHHMFHISMLQKYLRDPERQMTLKPITIEQDLTFEARPVRFLEEDDRIIRRRTLKFVKVP
jgi:hypothetical protein